MLIVSVQNVLFQDNGPAIIVGCVGFLVVGLLQLLLSLTVSKAWTALIFMFIMVVIGFLLHALAVPAFFVYQIVVSDDDDADDAVDDDNDDEGDDICCCRLMTTKMMMILMITITRNRIAAEKG